MSVACHSVGWSFSASHNRSRRRRSSRSISSFAGSVTAFIFAPHRKRGARENKPALGRMNRSPDLLNRIATGS